MSIARVALLISALLSPPAFGGGDTLVVNSTKDKPDADVLDGICDADLGKQGQQITLRAAIMHAATTPGTDLIQLPAGTYRLTRRRTGPDTPDTGDLDVPNALTIEGVSARKSIIDAKDLDDRIFQGSDCSMTLRDLTLKRGRPPLNDTDGGALFGVSVTLLMERCVVTGCRVTALGGGVALVQGSATIVDTTFKGNRAQDGGAVSMFGTGFTLERCSLSKNHADNFGGALYARDALGEVKNSTLSANDAANGGALFFGNGGTWGVSSCTIAKNFAESGSGIFEDTTDGSDDAIAVTNTIVANSKSTNYSGDGLTSEGGNIETGTTCGFTTLTDQEETNPRLTKLAKHGGKTATHGLKKNSPAIDRAVDPSAPATDQRGKSRVDVAGTGTSTADCGAFEFQP